MELNDMILKDFLVFLYGELQGEYIELRYINGKVTQKFCSTLDEVVANRTFNENVFFGVCTRNSQGGRKENVGRIVCLWGDVDGKDFQGGKEEALTSINKFALPPSIIVDSGNGFHCYWKLKQSCDISQAQKIEKLNEEIAKNIGGDKTHDIARILRLPTSNNCKDIYKPVKVVSFEESNVYELSDFDKLIISQETKWTGIVTQENQQGTRNMSSVQVAGKLIYHLPEELWDNIGWMSFTTWNQTNNNPPLTERELMAMWKSIIRTERDRRNQLKGGFNLIDLKQTKQKYFNEVNEIKNGTIEKIYTGFSRLDNLLGRVRGGHLITVGARPGVGKTSFLLKLCLNLSMSYNKSCLFFTAEMKWNELITKLIANLAHIDSIRLDEANISDDELITVQEKYEQLSKVKLSLCEITRFSKEKITTVIDQVQPDIIFIDYIQRFNVGINDNRSAMFSDIANSIKDIASEKSKIVFMASQLSREIEYRKTKEPELADLKESGGIEEASDKIILMWQEHFGFDKDVINIKIAKNRQGREGKLKLDFHKQYCDFQEI